MGKGVPGSSQKLAGGHHAQVPLSAGYCLREEGRRASESVLKNRLLGVSRENAYRPGPRLTRGAQEAQNLDPCLSLPQMSLSFQDPGILALPFPAQSTRAMGTASCLSSW